MHCRVLAAPLAVIYQMLLVLPVPPQNFSIHCQMNGGYPGGDHSPQRRSPALVVLVKEAGENGGQEKKGKRNTKKACHIAQLLKKLPDLPCHSSFCHSSYSLPKDLVALREMKRILDH